MIKAIDYSACFAPHSERLTHIRCSSTSTQCKMCLDRDLDQKYTAQNARYLRAIEQSQHPSANLMILPEGGALNQKFTAQNARYLRAIEQS